MTVDVFDDGIPDVSRQELTIDSQPTLIRLRCQGGASTVNESRAFANGIFDLKVTAQNDIVITPIINGCGAVSQLAQSFTHDGVLLEMPYGIHPKLAVLGLSPQPTVLPTTGGVSSLPCLLLPQPSVVALMQPNNGYSQPIPASARPIQFYIQAIDVISPSNVLASDGYQVRAH